MTAAAALALLTALVACSEVGPNVAAGPDAEPGDPAVYAPDGWPLQIGEKISDRRRQELTATVPGLGAVEGKSTGRG